MAKTSKSKPKAKGGMKSARVGGKVPSEAAKAFAEAVAALSFDQGPVPEDRDLVNVTFWAGAGFSKAWDPNCPTGSELFSFDDHDLDAVVDAQVANRLFGVKAFEGADADDLRQLVYQLDMFERYPDIRSRYFDEQNVRLIRARLRAAVARRFDRLAGLNYFDETALKFPVDSPSPAQRSILKFFNHIQRQRDGSQEFQEGVRPQFITTNYDYVIETILDQSSGPDDSLFLYNYRGFTPKIVVGAPPPTVMFSNWLTSHLIKINGGFEILRRGDDYELDYSARSQAEVAADPPVLMLPSREQDYSDPYFRTIFPKAVRLMRDTGILVLVGYSLPPDDALIRFILRQFAEEAEDGRHKVIFYIDHDPQTERLKEIFPALSDTGAPLIVPYRGGFHDFADECLSVWSSLRKEAAKKFTTLV